jgi:4-amino-4-deoxychorismate lyase
VAASPGFWIDGEPAAALPLPDRGLEFGDGVFETLLVVEGVVPLLDFHQDRLHQGLERLGFPADLPPIDELLAPALAQRSGLTAGLRLTVTRGGGPRGYAPDPAAAPRTILRLSPLQHDPRRQAAAARLGRAVITLAVQPALAGIKHLNRLEQVLAATDRVRQGTDEVIMFDGDANLVAVSAGNIFLRAGDCLRTPDLARCGIAGTRRRAIIERWAPALGLRVEIGQLQETDLAGADEVFYCSALAGIRPVATYRDQVWDCFDAAQALHAHYLRDFP